MPTTQTLETFSFEPDKIKSFYNWLQTEAAQQKGADFQIKLFFKWMGIDLTQKQQSSLLIQHYVGLGLRQLALYAYKSKDKSNDNTKQIRDLETKTRDNGETRYGFLNSDVAACVANLFGIKENLEAREETADYIQFEKINKKILKMGSGASEHFHLEGSIIVGNGNCLFNAMAQLAAEYIGFELITPDSEAVSSYIQGTIPNKPVVTEFTLSQNNYNSNVNLQENFNSEAKTLEEDNRALEYLEILKNKQGQDETFNEIIKAAGFDGHPTAFDLRKLIATQKAIYAQIQYNNTPTVFANNLRCGERSETSGLPLVDPVK